MKDKLLALALKLFGPKIVRQGLAAIGGFFAAQSMAVDAFNLPSLIGGAIAFVVVTAVSWISKTPPDASTKEKVSLFAQALASQAIAFLAGILQSWGYQGAMDDSAGVALFSLNYGLSKLSRPDPPAAPPLTGRAVSDRPPGL